MPKTGILILAAGASVRMGQPKQILPWKNSTLLGHAIEVANSISSTIMIVLGANAEKIKKQLPNQVKNILNKDWESGMGTSIAKGIAAFEQSADLDRVLIMLVDQPLIDVQYLQKLIDNANQNLNNIVATTYKNNAGVPALFPKKYFSELKLLNADYGAKHLMRKLEENLTLVDSNGKAADLDTPSNYQSFWERHGQ